MKFLVWCGCVTICLNGLQLSFFARDGWRWVWFPILAFYILSGLLIAFLGMARMVAGKSGGWLARVGSGATAPSHPPGTTK